MPDPKISFRPIAEEDRETLYRIYCSTRAEEMAMVPWSDADKDRFLRMQFHAQKIHYEKHYPQCQCRLILIEAQVAGRLYVDRDDKGIHIIDITLLPPFRGQGYGSTLLGDLIAESESTNQPILIYVEKNNPAKRLYKRLGFVEKEDVGVYDLMRRAVSASTAGA